MIYQHYKGDLYFLIGFVTRLVNDSASGHIIKKMTTAIHEESLERVDVLIVHDEKLGSTYYAYENEKYEKVFCLYKDLSGQYWLRPRELFFGDVDLFDVNYQEHYRKKRFQKVSGEYLFNIISKLVDNNSVEFDKCNKL